MALPDFLAFAPAPLRARRDGWSPELQRHFILLLARGAGVTAAARHLGRSRQTAYALRERPDAGGFAAAWDAAMAFARRARGASGLPLASAVDRLLVPRFYRGRLVGFVERLDNRGTMRTLAVLDRLAERLDRQGDLAGLRTWSERFEAMFGSEADKTDEMGWANGSTSSAFAAKAPPC